MLTIRRDSDIHDISGGWFRARWHFSFDTYEDPENDSLVDVPLQFEPVGVWRGRI